jgi:hypothetical protein
MTLTGFDGHAWALACVPKSGRLAAAAPVTIKRRRVKSMDINFSLLFRDVDAVPACSRQL